MNFTIEDTATNTSADMTTNTRPVKRGSDGSPHCTCRGKCSTKACGCVKSDKGCDSSCRCQQDLCKNRRVCSDTEDKENKPSSSIDFLSETPRPSYFDKRFESSQELDEALLRNLSLDEKSKQSPDKSANSKEIQHPLRAMSDRKLQSSPKQKWIEQLNATFVKKKKHFFFPPDDVNSVN